MRKFLFLLALLFVAPSWGQVTTDVTKTGINSQYLGEYAYASLPSASANKYRTALATDLGTNGTLEISNGTTWRPINGSASLYALGATTSNVANSETIVCQTKLPVGAWQANGRILVDLSMTKSGTTDGGVISIRTGTAGTTADTQVLLGTFLSAAAQTGGFILDLKLASNTTSLRVGTQGGSSAYTGGTSSAAVSPVTISDASANSLYVSVGISSSGATNTVALQTCRIQYIAP